MNVTALVATVLVLAVVFAIVAIAGAVAALLPERTRCPRCAERPLPLVTFTLLRAVGLERRWCFACGWSGIGRRGAQVEPGRGVEPSQSPASHVEEENEAWRPLSGDDSWRPDGGRDFS